MKRKNATRSALFTSIISLLLCVSMLVGTTFAWFTDEVNSGINTIAAGNLDIELWYASPKDADGNIITNYAELDWNPVAADTKLFNDAALWEPGYAEAVYLKIVNAGTLALKYKLNINVVDEIVGKSVLGNDIALSEILMVNMEEAFVEEGDTPNLFTKRDDATFDIGQFWGVSLHKTIKEKEGDEDVAMLPGEEVFVKLAVYMPTSTGNEANYVTGTEAPQIKMGMKLTAAQLEHESDSFGPDYDEDAQYFPVVTSAADLINALQNGQSVSLGNDIELEETLEISEGVTVALNLNGYALSGNNTKDAGALLVNNGTLSIYGGEMANKAVNGGAVIDNKGILTLDGVTVNGAPIDTTSYPAYAVYTSGKLTVEAGTTISSDRGAIYLNDGADVVINGGSISVTDALGDRALTAHVIYAYGKNSTLTINDGNFALNYAASKNVGASVICPAGATIDVYGGNFSYAGTTGGQSGIFQNYMGYGAPVNVYGGTFDDTTVNKNLATGYKVTQEGENWVVGPKATDNAGLQDAIAAGEKEIALGAGDYSMPTTTGNVTITGTKDTVITINKPTANNVTLNGVTVVGSGNYTGIQHSNSVVYENCDIIGTQFLYAEKVVFKNCTVDLTAKADYIWTYGAKEVEFIDCTFNTQGKAILIYSEDKNLTTKVTVKGCAFNATQSALASGATAAAIEIDSSLATNGHYTLVTEINTVDSDFSGEWRIKKSGKNNTTVNGSIYNAITIDGVTETPIIGDSQGTTYEGDLFEPGATDFLVAQNVTLEGDATITVKRTYNTVALENVTADVNGNLITAECDNTIILHECNITLDEGEMLIVTTNGATVGQVMIHNVTVNGVLLTQETAAQYMQGVNWCEVW